MNPKGGWQLFGAGLLDSAVDVAKSEFVIQVDWSQSTWGVGGMFTLDSPIGSENLSAIQLEVRTKKGSKAKIYTELATLGDANVVFPRNKAKDVTNKWQTLISPVADMINDRPNRSSTEFVNADWKKIRIIKILFATPEEESPAADDIFIRDPELIFNSPKPIDKEGSDKIKKSSIQSEQRGRALTDFEGLKLDNPITPALEPHYDADNSHGLGREAYEKTMDLSTQAQNEGKSQREISNVLLYGAGKCRDQGAYDYAITLFNAATQEDPTNANAHRVYGDFLMGYRGLYEHAAERYFVAQELIEKNPESYDDKLKDALTRSLHILHRDGQDGVPLHTSKKMSFFFTSSLNYSKPSVDPWVLFDQQLRVEKIINDEDEFLLSLLEREENPVGSIDERLDEEGNTIRSRMAENAIKRDAIPFKLDRRNEVTEYDGELLIRLGKKSLPYFRLSWVESNINTSNINPEDLEHPFDGEFKGLSALIGKNVLISPNLDLNFEGIFRKNRVRTDDSFNNTRIAKAKSNTYNLESRLTFYLAANTLKLSLGGTFSEIDRTEGGINSKQFDDTSNSERINLRLSTFKPPQKAENPSRFRGRRSNHYEFSLLRTENRIEIEANGKDTPVNYKPQFGLEVLGLHRGYIDLFVNYNLSISESSSGPSQGNIESHQVRIIPSYVTVYNLYSEDFVTGIEFFSIDFPFEVTYGENDGDYERYRWGVGLNAVITTPLNFRLFPKLTADYAYYPDLNRDDWGVFAGLTVRY